jgi:hypothetical protein
MILDFLISRNNANFVRSTFSLRGGLLDRQRLFRIYYALLEAYSFYGTFLRNSLD